MAAWALPPQAGRELPPPLQGGRPGKFRCSRRGGGGGWGEVAAAATSGRGGRSPVAPGEEVETEAEMGGGATTTTATSGRETGNFPCSGEKAAAGRGREPLSWRLEEEVAAVAEGLFTWPAPKGKHGASHVNTP